MLIALVKSVVDVCGPWSSVMYGEELRHVWPGKASGVSTTLALEADWYVIDKVIPSTYYEQLKGLGYWEIVREHTKNVVDSVDYSKYDVVISFNPILNPPESDTLFCYYVSETFDRLYDFDVRDGYDLMLDHMLKAGELKQIPQAVSFPFIYNKQSIEKNNKTWVDFRTINKYGVPDLPIENIGCFNDKPYGIHDPPLWGDAFDYLDSLSRCKYYIGIGRDAGPGQALAEAASFGCACIGDDRPYHKLICHPKNLCSTMDEAVARIEELGQSGYQETISYQDRALREHFYNKPLSILKRAIELKRGIS